MVPKVDWAQLVIITQYLSFSYSQTRSGVEITWKLMSGSLQWLSTETSAETIDRNTSMCLWPLHMASVIQSIVTGFQEHAS